VLSEQQTVKLFCTEMTFFLLAELY